MGYLQSRCLAPQHLVSLLWDHPPGTVLMDRPRAAPSLSSDLSCGVTSTGGFAGHFQVPRSSHAPVTSYPISPPYVFVELHILQESTC